MFSEVSPRRVLSRKEYAKISDAAFTVIESPKCTSRRHFTTRWGSVDQK